MYSTERKTRMINRPPVQQICSIDENGNPGTYTVGRGCTEIREVEEPGEYALIPWVEVWDGERLIARFNQHKLESIIY
jgi:hypothetical protein